MPLTVWNLSEEIRRYDSPLDIETEPLQFMKKYQVAYSQASRNKPQASFEQILEIEEQHTESENEIRALDEEKQLRPRCNGPLMKQYLAMTPRIEPTNTIPYAATKRSSFRRGP